MTNGATPDGVPVALDRLRDAKLHPNSLPERQGVQALISRHGRAFLAIPSCTVGLLAVLIACGLAPHAKIALCGLMRGRSAVATIARQQDPVLGPRINASREYPILEHLRINVSGDLWPPFSPDITNYEIELDPVRSGDVPHVELQVSLPLGAAPGPPPQLHLDGEELDLGPRGAVRWRAELPRLRPGGRSRYQLLLLEVLAPPGVGRRGRAYALRVLRPPEAPGPRPARRLEPEAPRGPAGPVGPAGRAPALVRASRTAVGISLVDGHCARAAGPFQRPPRESAPAGRLGLWSADTEHVVCFSPRGGNSEDEVQFVATAADGGFDAARPGEFGFGPGVAVSLRPDIETTAVWPLEAGVQSLSLGIGSGESFRTLALRTRADGDVLDMPIVVARPARQRWPIAVQLLNGSLGACSPAPALDVARFVCRTRKDAVGALAHFVVFCRTCIFGGDQVHKTSEAPMMHRTWSVNVSDDKGRGVLTTLNSDDNLLPGVPAPWIGWSAEVPAEGSAQQWIVKLHRPPGKLPSLETSNVQIDATEFEVALVAGDGIVPWMLDPAEEGVFRWAGVGMSIVAVSMLVAVVAVLVLASCGFPAPTSAMLPSLSSAFMVLQFLALLGGCAASPKLLRCLGRPLSWIAPVQPVHGLLQALAALLAVAVLHAAAVWRYLMINGSGSARALPHGLVFGAWELRALPFLALPLSAAASALAGAGEGPAPLLGGALLCSLLAAPACVLRRLRAWFADERVLCVPLPGTGQAVYTDRLCDQLRAMPVAPGRTSLLGDWPASPGWCVAPAVAAIRDLEHRGSPAPEEPQGSWSAVWPPGPWALQGAGTTPQTPRSSGAIYKRQGSKGSCRSGACEGMGFRKDLMSPVYNEHPIQATLEFAYEGKKYPCIAGVVGLPWVDAAVLADSLRGIRPLVPSLAVQVHAGQLSGPLTGGRLAACFEWGDREPWRWSVDIMVKVLLGAYVGILSSTMPSEVTSQVLWHGGVSGLVALLAVAVPAMQPYIHLVDNLALMSALLAVSLGAAVLALGERLPRLVPAAGAALVALGLAPPTLAGTAGALAAASAALWRRRGLRERLVPATVQGWGSSSSSSSSSRGASSRGACRSTRDDKYVGVWCEDGPLSPTAADSASAYSHTADLVLLSLSDGVGAAKSRICLPAELKLSLVHRELHGNHRGKAHSSTVCGEGIRVPVPAGLLFTPEQEGLDRAAAKPFAALLTPNGGQLLYMEAALNGGVSWNEAVRCFFHDNQILAKEAEDILREHEQEVLVEACGEGLMVVLEFNSSMGSSTQPSWRTCR